MQFVGLDHQIFLWDCQFIGVTTLGPGEQGNYFTTKPVSDAFAWINTTYAIEFWNPFLRTPAFSAAVNGISHRNTRSCPRRGTRAVRERAIDEGQTHKFHIYDK